MYVNIVTLNSNMFFVLIDLFFSARTACVLFVYYKYILKNAVCIVNVKLIINFVSLGDT